VTPNANYDFESRILRQTCSINCKRRSRLMLGVHHWGTKCRRKWVCRNSQHFPNLMFLQTYTRPKQINSTNIKQKNLGTSLVVQGLRRQASHTAGSGSVAGWGTKISHATQFGQKYKNLKTKVKKKKKQKKTTKVPSSIPHKATLWKTPHRPAGFGVAAVDVPTVSPAVVLGCALLVAQVVNNPPANAEDSISIPGPRRSPCRRARQPAPEESGRAPVHGATRNHTWLLWVVLIPFQYCSHL